MTRSARHSARVTPALAPAAQLKASVARWKASIAAEKRQRLQASFLCFTLPAWTPSRGAEIDILELTGRTINAYEAKSGQTVSVEFTKQLGEAVASLRGACKSQQELRPVLVYGGDTSSRRHDVDILSWADVGEDRGPPLGEPVPAS